MKTFSQHVAEGYTKLPSSPRAHAELHAKNTSGKYQAGEDGSHLVHDLIRHPEHKNAAEVHVTQYWSDDGGKSTKVKVHKFPLRKHTQHYGEMFEAVELDEAKKSIQHDFRLHPDADANGTHLLHEMPDVKDDHIAKVFGAKQAMRGKNKEKYTQSFGVKDHATGHEYHLYKSYGKWRIGGHEARHPIFNKTGIKSQHTAELHQHIIKHGGRA